ncbi:unnamed protein product [Closterium sp. Yama58-4]|nr:unnamed protein product [Closterium sp. Yama58-4]
MGDDMEKTEAQLLLMRLYPDLNQLSAGERVQQRVKRMGGDVRQLVKEYYGERYDGERVSACENGVARGIR